MKKEFFKNMRCNFISNLFFNLPGERVLVLKELYLSNIACVVHLNEREKQDKDREPLSNLFETTIGEKEKDTLSVNRVKSSLGNLMHLIANYLEQFGLQVPQYCIVSTSLEKDTSEIIKIIKDLSNDQDWSRGNFAIMPAGKDIKKVIGKIILDMGLDEIEFMEPISTDIFEKRLREEMSSKNLSEDHEELIQIIINSIVNKSSPEQLIESWVKGRLKDLENYAKR
jgi:hypothetical protein